MMPYYPTQDEIRLLELLVEGKNNNEIANVLCRSVKTIEYRMTMLMRAYRVKNRVQLAVKYTKARYKR